MSIYSNVMNILENTSSYSDYSIQLLGYIR